MDHILPVYYFSFFDVLFQMLFTFVSAAITYWLTLVPSLMLVGVLVLFPLPACENNPTGQKTRVCSEK